jgi:TPP-dependent pyruvate/acetoin dehydrogenase alpha subunit
MTPDLWSLYAIMLRSRLFEESVTQLWNDGAISGEMHLGTGEEAIVAGIVPQLRDGDAMALDHRATSAMLVRGVDPILLLREMLGRPDGLCGGMGGHMHLFSKEHLAASSGIVGAEGPAAVGFAVAVAFFGDGAMNQGMLLEAMNLASAWKLPVLFVCKDDRWAITTESQDVTGGNLCDRARGFGLPATEVEGWDVAEVWEAARQAIQTARAGYGPTFLRARCVHLEGHFLGFQLLRAIRSPLTEMPRIAIPLTRSFLRPGGASLRERISGLAVVLSAILTTLRDPRRNAANDPVPRTRAALQSDLPRLQELEEEIRQEVWALLSLAMQECAV